MEDSIVESGQEVDINFQRETPIMLMVNGTPSRLPAKMVGNVGQSSMAKLEIILILTTVSLTGLIESILVPLATFIIKISRVL
jgi:hypothetical protein